MLAEGQAALMVAEKSAAVLLEAKVLDKERLVDAIETVITTKRAMMIDGKAPEVAGAAIGLLSGIANSLTAVAGAPPPSPSIASGDRCRG
jgi:hypothetical protein